ncbi:DMT family transporter [Actinokineospora sp. NBRC 105648]|uniref:DMT family transporter n=1 Tax=Actinokineospora sp. NBRC 105648 TaxID=3032206 RepID=UPI0024A2F79F|nr:DMT family transporter [Actinokineospora sp. NBRC 105648]GLZ38641.1 permease [Actinokineospora sp. NBRC 105648]
MGPQARGLTLAALGAVAVGSSAPALKLLAHTELTPVNVIQARTAVGAVALLAIALARRRGMLVQREHWWLVGLYGVVTIAANQVAYTAALTRVPVGIALLLEYLAPVLVALWVRFARRTRLPRLLWVGIAVTLAGLAVVASTRTAGGIDPVGVLFGLLAAVTLAGRFLLAERGLRSHEPIVLAGWGAAVGAVALSVIDPFPLRQLGDARVWPLVLWVGLVGTAAAVLLAVSAQRLIPPTAASAVACLEIVVGAGAAWVVLDESMPASGLAGAAAVLAGIVVVQFAVARHDDREWVTSSSGGRSSSRATPPGRTSGRRRAPSSG